MDSMAVWAAWRYGQLSEDAPGSDPRPGRSERRTVQLLLRRRLAARGGIIDFMSGALTPTLDGTLRLGEEVSCQQAAALLDCRMEGVAMLRLMGVKQNDGDEMPDGFPSPSLLT